MSSNKHDYYSIIALPWSLGSFQHADKNDDRDGNEFQYSTNILMIRSRANADSKIVFLNKDLSMVCSESSRQTLSYLPLLKILASNSL